MGFLDRIFGGVPAEPPTPQAGPAGRRLSDDELAVERYRYLLRTAPPESVEAVHAEAFAKLTPQQRQAVFASLSSEAPAGERLVSDEPSALARAATRAELRAPGSVERAFDRADAAGGRRQHGGPSFGGMFAGSLLGTVAGVVVGSAIAQAFLPDSAAFEASGGSDASGADSGGGSDASGADSGGDFGGFGDFGGGGDFGF
ncbi:hypothetical protein [Agromyces laixinhei]|uniref:hypothetical protein n=1 Tax=Agromyces laixinhei TaxID=2585717 RepID=UPI0012EE6718|nr:hypothetical protein [Agromyces laixinhei]